MRHVRVAAYITAYEDPAALKVCISSIQHQTYPVSEIIIVDNSHKRILGSEPTENIIVKHYPENIGISGGLEVGINWAIEKGYDFLWTFDQDSQPDTNCLEYLLEAYDELTSQQERIGIIAPLSIDLNTRQELPGNIFNGHQMCCPKNYTDDLHECDVVNTSGALVSIEAAKHSELPETGLFIDAVDWDYGMNMKRKGFKTFITRKARMLHRFSELKKVKSPFSSKEVVTFNYSPLRRYYICRNHTYVCMKFADPANRKTIMRQRVRYFIDSSVDILLFEKGRKIEKVWFGLIGTLDGFLGRLGKRVIL